MIHSYTINYTHTHTHTQIYIYIYIYTYTYIYIYVYIYMNYLHTNHLHYLQRICFPGSHHHLFHLLQLLGWLLDLQWTMLDITLLPRCLWQIVQQTNQTTAGKTSHPSPYLATSYNNKLPTNRWKCIPLLFSNVSIYSLRKCRPVIF